jgi:hypothetical protein
MEPSGEDSAADGFGRERDGGGMLSRALNVIVLWLVARLWRHNDYLPTRLLGDSRWPASRSDLPWFHHRRGQVGGSLILILPPSGLPSSKGHRPIPPLSV